MQLLKRLLGTKSILALLLSLLASVSWGAPVMAQSAAPVNRAGLVVVAADGSVESRCVGFAEESIDGYELLTRGGFAARTEATSMGAMVCSLDGQGCGEGEDCFCQCKSSTCAYWTYWQLLPEGWRYSNAGAATVQVDNGDVQGWVWGDSKPNAEADSTPPMMAFADICTSEAVVYGMAAATAEDETGTVSQVGIGLNQVGMAAIVVGAPLLLGGAWWVWQRRKGVQP